MLSSTVHAVRAETTKLFSTRSTIVYAVLLAGSLFGPVTLVAVFSEPGLAMNWGPLQCSAPH